MFHRLIIVALAVFTCLPLAEARTIVYEPGKRPPAGMISGKLIPMRPTNRIHDEVGAITDENLNDLVEELRSASDVKIEIYVAILKNVPEVEPYQLGNEILRRWSSLDAEASALVLSLPPVSPEPYVFMYSRLIEGAETARLEELGKQAVANSDHYGESPNAAFGTAMDLATNLPPACQEIIEEMEEKRALARDIEADLAARAKQGEADETAAEKWQPTMGVVDSEEAAGNKDISRLGMFWRNIQGAPVKLALYGMIGAAGLLGVVGGTCLLRRSRPMLFPKTEHRKRFSAPFSGGNNIYVELKRTKANLYEANG